MKKVIILIAISLFSVVISLADDLLPIISRNRVGYINPNGDIVIATTLDTDVEWAKETFRGEKYKYPKFPQNAYFSEGLAVVCKDGKWGFIDENNNFVIKPTYDYVKSFQSGGALVFKDGRLYYINKSGKIIYTF